MLKSSRAFFGVAFLVCVLVAFPLSLAQSIRSRCVSFLKNPLSFSSWAAQTARDLYYFEKNAEENRFLKDKVAEIRYSRIQVEEVSRENQRLTRLLDLRQTLPLSVRNSISCRVIGRSLFTWNRVFLIDKGARQGVRVNMLALSERSLVGKVIEVGPSVSKVLLVTDPNARIAVLVQRTRQEGMLYGSAAGECHVKYLSLDADLRAGDVVESAGLGGFFPKGLVVGTITRSWKEPGQIYRVAEVKPLTDLSRIEELVCVE